MTARKAKDAPAADKAAEATSPKEELTVQTDHTTVVAGAPTVVPDANAVAGEEGVEVQSPPDGLGDITVATDPHSPEDDRADALARLAAGPTPEGAGDTFSAVAAPQPNGKEINWGNGRTRGIVSGTVVTAFENGVQLQAWRGDTLITSAELIDKFEKLGVVYREKD